MKLVDKPTLYINLDKDLNRKISLEKDLNKLNMEYNRIEVRHGKRLYESSYRKRLSRFLKISEKNWHPRYWLDRHNFKTMVQKEMRFWQKSAAVLSHLVALKVALNLGYQNVLILEDDAMFLKNAYREFTIPENTGYFFITHEVIFLQKKTT